MAQAVYRINDFILDQIPTLLQYTGSGLKPIFPVQETPESNALPGPFLLYTFRTSNYTDEWWRCVEDVTYLISSTDVEESAAIAEALTDLFRRMDESAADLMKYLKANNKTDYQFYYTKVVNQLSPTIVTDEGASHFRPLTIRYEYSKTSGRGIS